MGNTKLRKCFGCNATPEKNPSAYGGFDPTVLDIEYFRDTLQNPNLEGKEGNPVILCLNCYHDRTQYTKAEQRARRRLGI